MKSLVILFALFALAFGIVVKVPLPYADTYTSSAEPTTNFGSQSLGSVFKDPMYGYTFDLLCTFNVSNLAGNASDATIWFKQPYVTSDEIEDGYYVSRLTFDVYEMSESWFESNITFSNAPDSIRKTTTTPHNDGNVNYLIAPVKNIFNDARRDERSFISVRIRSTVPSVDVYMKETISNLNRPYMLITYP
jgi:hypothetical protein